MTANEHLAAIIKKAAHISLPSNTSEEHLRIFTNCLIAHGVTVQGWISVNDRLPEDSATVNLCTRSRIVGTGFYDKYTRSWVQYYSGGSISVDVTHWMPLPPAPKGE